MGRLVHRCRRGDGSRITSWHPTIDVDVERYEIEKRMKQLESEIARLEQVNSRLERFELEHLSGSTPPPSTGDSYS